MSIRKTLFKFFNKKKYNEYKNEKILAKNKILYNKFIKIKLNKITSMLNEKKEINFLHSGHAADEEDMEVVDLTVPWLSKCFMEIFDMEKVPFHLEGESNEALLTALSEKMLRRFSRWKDT